MILGKLLSLSWPQFPDTTHFIVLLSSSDKGIHVKHLKNSAWHITSVQVYISYIMHPKLLCLYEGCVAIVSLSKLLCAKHCAYTGGREGG